MKTNNVLILGPPHSGKIRIAQHLTNDLDSSTIPSHTHSGLIYNYQLRTKYFSLEVNLLIEEYPDSRASTTPIVTLLQSFLKELESPEFTELRDALDGLVFTIDICIDSETLLSLLDTFVKIKELLEDNELFVLVVGFAKADQKSILEVAEDAVISHGFEYINFNEHGKNEYMENIGKDRLVEVFHTHEWPQVDKPISDESYAQHKTEKLGYMAENLIDHEDSLSTDERLARVDLDTLFAKLNVDKQRAQGLSDEEKKQFVDDLVDNYMEYF